MRRFKICATGARRGFRGRRRDGQGRGHDESSSCPRGSSGSASSLRRRRPAFFVVKDARRKARMASPSISAPSWDRRSACRWSSSSRRIRASSPTRPAPARIDVAFMPVDEERKKRVDFGPAYFLIESTYMATAASGGKDGGGRGSRRHARDRHRQHDHDPRRRPHAEEHDDLGRAFGGRGGRDAARRQGRRLRALARLASRSTSSRFRDRASSTAASSRPASRSRCRRGGRPRSPP